MNNPFFNPVDISIGLFVLIFLIFGFAKGVARQFFGILAVSIATAVGILVPCFIKIPQIEGISVLWKNAIFSVLIWVPVYLVLNAIGKFFAKKIEKKGIRFKDRIWGALFGALKGTIIVVVLIFATDILPIKISDSIQQSRVVSIVRPFNPLLKIKIFRNLQSIIFAESDPDYRELLDKDLKFKELMQNEKIESIMEDQGLRNIIEKQQYMRFIIHPKIQEMIKDKETLKQLLSVDDVDKIIIQNI